MKKYLVRVTESIHHEYEIEAATSEEALTAYDKFTLSDLKKLDLDGSSSWDSPWDIEEVAE